MLREQNWEPVFARAFMNITWNLICQSKNTTMIHLHHLEWTEYCPSIYFAHMKNDQTGDSKRDPDYIYGSPIDPTVCPVLALVIYFTTFLFHVQKIQHYFQERTSTNDFLNILN